MPEFENLEPFFDDKGKGRPTPVAPHGESAHEFQPRRTEGQRRSQTNRLRPRKVKLSESERVSTEAMEREFKAALKAEKKRDRSRGQSPLQRLLRTVKSWFTGGDQKSRKPGKRSRARPGERNRERGERNRERGEPQGRRGGKGGKRADRRPSGGDTPGKNSVGGRPKKKRRPKGDRSQGHAPGKKAASPRNEPKSSARQPRSGNAPANPSSGGPSNKPEGAAKGADNQPKKRRGRRNRKRRPPTDHSGPSAHEA